MSFNPSTFVLSITLTFAPDPLVFTRQLDFGTAIPGLAFDAYATVTATVTPTIHLPIRIDLSATPGLTVKDRFYLVNDGTPDVSLGVSLNVDSPANANTIAFAQLGLLGLRLSKDPNTTPNTGATLGAALNVIIVDPDGVTGNGKITATKLLNFANITKAFSFTLTGNLNIDGLLLTPDVAGITLPIGQIRVSIDGKTKGKVTSLADLKNLLSNVNIQRNDKFGDFKNLSPGAAVSLLIQIGDTLQSIASKLDVPGGIPYVRDAASQVVNFSKAVTDFARKLYFPPVLAAAADMQLPDAGLSQGTGIFVQVETGAPVFVPVTFDGRSTLQGVIDAINTGLAQVGLGGKLMAVLQGSRFTLTTVEGRRPSG